MCEYKEKEELLKNKIIKFIEFYASAQEKDDVKYYDVNVKYDLTTGVYLICNVIISHKIMNRQMERTLYYNEETDEFYILNLNDKHEIDLCLFTFTNILLGLCDGKEK